MKKILFLLVYVVICMDVFAQDPQRCMADTKYGRCTNDAVIGELYCTLHKDNTGIATTPKSGQSVATEQCKAITKTGTRCSRMARQGEEYCWQHANSTTTVKQRQQPAKVASTGGRCRARTKKGTQCSRSARSNGLCWQHGG